MPMPPQVYPPTPLAEPQVSPIEESVLENVAESMMGSNDATPKAGTSENTPTPKQEEKNAELVPDQLDTTKPLNAEETADPVPPPPTADGLIKSPPSPLEESASHPPPPPAAPTTAAALVPETLELEKTTVALA